MSSSYTGVPATSTATLELPTGGDIKTVQSMRVPLERLLDNDAALTAAVNTVYNTLALVGSMRLRRHSQSGVTITDTAESMGATQRNRGVPVVACKTGQAFQVSEWDRLVEIGAPGSITSLVTDAANDDTRILIIGTGGASCAYSDDDGASWTNGGVITGTPKRLVWNDSDNLFMCTTLASNAVSTSPNGALWTINGGAACSPTGGLAMLSSGDTFGVSSAVAGVIRRTTNGALTFTSPITIPNSGSFDDFGTVASDAGNTFYHAARLSSGASIQISNFTNGDAIPGAMTVIASIAPPTGHTFSSEPRIMQCQNTSLLALVAPVSGSKTALYASLDGVTWVGPLVIAPAVGVDAFALAGGKLQSTFNDELFASDGLGGIL